MSSDSFVALSLQTAAAAAQFEAVGGLVEGGAGQRDIEKIFVISEFSKRHGEIFVKVIPAKAKLVGWAHAASRKAKQLKN